MHIGMPEVGTCLLYYETVGGGHDATWSPDRHASTSCEFLDKTEVMHGIYIYASSQSMMRLELAQSLRLCEMIDVCYREWWSMTVQSTSVCIIRNGDQFLQLLTLLILIHIYKVLGNRWTYREHYHLNHLCKRTWLESFTSDRVRQPAASKDYSTIAIGQRTLKLASRAQERTPGTYSIHQTSLSSSGARAKNG